MRHAFALLLLFAALPGVATPAERARAFAALPGEPWSVVAYTRDGHALSFCTAERRDGARTVALKRDWNGYWLVVDAGMRSLLPTGPVRLTAGAGFDEASRGEPHDGAVAVALGPAEGLAGRLIEAVHRDGATTMTVRGGGSVISVPFDGANGALVEMETCWRNAAPEGTNR